MNAKSKILLAIGRANARRIAEDIVNVQPLPNDCISALYSISLPESELIARGYKPVSHHRLAWIKKDD